VNATISIIAESIRMDINTFRFGLVPNLMVQTHFLTLKFSQMFLKLQQITLQIPAEKWKESLDFYKNLGFKIVEESNGVYMHLFSTIGFGLSLVKGKTEPIEFTIEADQVMKFHVGICYQNSQTRRSCGEYHSVRCSKI
jgi:hypothetical protein